MIKELYDDECLFYCIKVKFKKEIVIMGVEGIDLCEVVGIYVKFVDWNVLILDFEVIFIDMCNDYEIEIGIF